MAPALDANATTRSPRTFRPVVTRQNSNESILSTERSFVTTKSRPSCEDEFQPETNPPQKPASDSKSSATRFISSILTKNHKAPDPKQAAALRAAIDTAKTKPFGDLLTTTAKGTNFARNVHKYSAWLGVVVAVGLLFSPVSPACLLVIPAFLMVGVGIGCLVRKFINERQDPQIEAFKEIMKGRLENPTDKELLSPQFIEAEKMYSFLTGDLTKVAFNKVTCGALELGTVMKAANNLKNKLVDKAIARSTAEQQDDEKIGVDDSRTRSAAGSVHGDDESEETLVPTSQMRDESVEEEIIELTR